MTEAENKLVEIVENLRKEEARWDAMLELKLLDCKSLEDKLIDYMEDPEWVVRWSIAEKMGEMKSLPVMKCLIKKLGDPDSHVQKNVSKSLTRFGEKAIPYIIPYLLHPVTETRLAAYSVLRSQKRDISGLLAEAAKKSNRWLASSLLHMIWLLKGPSAEDALIGLLHEKHCQKVAITLLAFMRSEKALDELLKLYANPELRRPILLVFKRVGDQLFFPFILGACFIDKNPDAQAIVFKIGAPILPYLVRLLKRRAAYPYEKVAAMIVKIGPEPVRKELLAHKDIPEIGKWLAANPPKITKKA